MHVCDMNCCWFILEYLLMGVRCCCEQSEDNLSICSCMWSASVTLQSCVVKRAIAVRANFSRKGSYEHELHADWSAAATKLSSSLWKFCNLCNFVGTIANLKGPYFQPSLSVCLWRALLPFSNDRFWWNLVTRTLLWSSLAATIMVQIGRRETVRRLFENLKNHRIQISEFWSIIFCICVSCVL